MYHLAWFLGSGCGLPPWDPAIAGPWAGNIANEWMKPAIYVDLARSLERAGFSYLLIEDTTQLDDHYGGTAEVTLRRGYFSPKGDPMPMVPMIAAGTKHIGLVPTVSSSFYHPYLAARLFTTLDHITEGRVGLNLVTSSSDIAAKNFGMDALPPKELRYKVANEWIDVFRQLEGAWAPDAVLADVERGIYADYTKVKTIDYEGKYFKCRGPLNTIPGPQRHLPMVEAGNSPAGRDLAAREANSIIGNCMNVAAMKELRADMTARVAAHGRDPRDFKTMFVCVPIIGATDDEAKRRQEAGMAAKSSDAGIEYMRWYLGKMTPIDFSTIDMDMLVSDLKDQVTRTKPDVISTVQKMFVGLETRTVREMLALSAPALDLGLVGSPTTIAKKMDELMEEVGGDGFLFYLPTIRHTITEICDGLAPVLQRRGSIRSSYNHATFKENLLAF
jgi:FMN-dependent oxidoreductase (nitrilotriacetate monooxygenase family)